MAQSGGTANQGIVKDDKGQEQPADKRRAQTAHKSDSGHSVSREAMRDPKRGDTGKASGSSKARDGGDTSAD